MLVVMVVVVGGDGGGGRMKNKFGAPCLFNFCLFFMDLFSKKLLTFKFVSILTQMYSTIPRFRSNGLVPEVRIRRLPLAAESNGAHDWLRAVQPRLFLPVPGVSPDGRQRDEEVRHRVHSGQALRTVRSG